MCVHSLCSHGDDNHPNSLIKEQEALSVTVAVCVYVRLGIQLGCCLNKTKQRKTSVSPADTLVLDILNLPAEMIFDILLYIFLLI